MIIKIDAMKRFIKFAVGALCSLAITACEAKEPEMVSGLAVHVFNYSQDSIVFVKINGQRLIVGADKAKIGDIEGGGGSCCPLALSPTDKTAEVIVETAKAAGDYKATATIEHPWPSDPSTAFIHILPGRKVVIEVGLGGMGGSVGRRDLLEAQIKALGLKPEVPFSRLLKNDFRNPKVKFPRVTLPFPDIRSSILERLTRSCFFRQLGSLSFSTAC